MSLAGILDQVSDVTTFDRVIEPARRAVQGALRPQALKDFLHGSWLGHPLHPVMVQVPVGAWASAGVLDLFVGTERLQVHDTELAARIAAIARPLTS